MEKEVFTKDELKVVNYYIKQLKSDNVPSYQDLKKYLKKRRINFGNKKATNETLQKIKRNVKESVVYSNLKRIKFHQTVTIDNLGLLSADFAYYYPELKSYNKNNVGFLMVVSVNANKRWAVPMKSRTTQSFESALEEICLGNIFPAVNTVISDRESAVFSKSFQARMKEKYNINFQFMYRMNKAWSAENAIRYTKQDLTIVRNSKMTKNWIDVLQSVIAVHNRKKIGNTEYSPNDINDSNFFDFLSKYNNVKDITLDYNTNSISFKSIPKGDWRKKTLIIDVGDKVLASFKSMEGTKIMQKPSVDGTYSKQPFYVTDGFLRITKDKKNYVPGNFLKIFFQFFINFVTNGIRTRAHYCVSELKSDALDHSAMMT